MSREQRGHHLRAGFGARITQALQLAGKSQRQLADELEITHGAVSMWCNGQRAPGLFDIPALAHALGTSPSMLAWGKSSDQDVANLGLATTNQLLEEIRARIEIDSYRGGGGLGYRTVDPELSTPHHARAIDINPA